MLDPECGTTSYRNAKTQHPTVIPSDGTFNPHRTTIRDSFSCILFLRQFMCCFINFKLKLLHIFLSRNVRSGSFLKRLAEYQNIKMKSKHQNRRLDVLHGSRLTPTPPPPPTPPSPPPPPPFSVLVFAKSTVKEERL